PHPPTASPWAPRSPASKRGRGARSSPSPPGRGERAGAGGVLDGVMLARMALPLPRLRRGPLPLPLQSAVEGKGGEARPLAKLRRQCPRQIGFEVDGVFQAD